MNIAEKGWTTLLAVVALNIIIFSSQTPAVVNAVFGSQGLQGLVGTLEKQGG